MKKIYILGISIFLIFVAGISFWNIKSKEPDTDSLTTQIVQENKDVVKINTDNYVGKIALVATQSEAKVETSGTGKNAFVTSINDRVADAKKNEFWEFKVNGKQASVGVGSYIIQKGDKIEWKISTF